MHRKTLTNVVNRCWMYLREEKGSALFEFTIVGSMLFVMTFAMIDFSRAVYARSAVQAAAQEGARAGIVSIDSIHAAVEEKLLGLDVSRAVITVNQPDADSVEVDVVYDFEFVMPVISELAGDGFEFNGSATMLIR